MWRDYAVEFEQRIDDLHGRIHRGAYRAKPSKRIYIPKPDGRMPRLGIAALLDDLVLQSGDSQRSHLAIRLRDVGPLGRLGPVGSAMDSSVQIVDPPFKIHRVVAPRLAVDSRRPACFFSSKKLAAAVPA